MCWVWVVTDVLPHQERSVLARKFKRALMVLLVDAVGQARPSDVLLAEILGGRREGLVTQSISWP